MNRVHESGDHVLKALDGVDMSLDEGKFVVVFGSNEADNLTV